MIFFMTVVKQFGRMTKNNYCVEKMNFAGLFFFKKMPTNN